MAEPGDGVDALRARVERRSRSVPPPRRPRETNTGTTSVHETDHGSGGPTGSEEPPIEGSSEQGGGDGRASTAVEAANPPGALLPESEPTRLERSAPGVGYQPPSLRDQMSMPASQSSTAGSGDAPTANLTLRVRQSLDFRLAELIHELRREGVRSSKKELIEMCLWELPSAPNENLRTRLRSYRDHLPRDL